MSLLCLLILTLLCSSSYTAPLNETKILNNENDDLIDDDVLVDDDEYRFGHYKKSRVWDDKMIPYIIDSDLEYKSDVIKSAMFHISNKTCIRFTERTTEENYLRFYMGNGCKSYVGCKRSGEQLLSLAEGCHSFGTVVHEIMHAIGFHHQHKRVDRDSHLIINWENIKRGHEHNFYKLDNGLIFAQFDYDSIMHYGSTTFSVDRKSPTITPIKNGVKLVKPRHKTGLSELDIVSINKMYNC